VAPAGEFSIGTSGEDRSGINNKVAEDGTATAISLEAIPAGHVFMAAGNGYLVWTAGGNAYWTDGSDAGKINDPDLPKVSSVAYTDGYWIFVEQDTGRWFVTAINNPKDINALDFASAESQPDDIKRVIVAHREVWLLGTETIEVWQNTGNADFPFERYNPAAIDRGIMSAASAAVLDNAIFWVGDDSIVYRGEGYTPSAISTPEVSKAIDVCSDKAGIVGFTWSQEGHVLYALRLPGVSTWIYDASTQLWHERETFGRDLWRAGTHAKVYGKHVVGDDTTGGLYTLDFGTYTDGGGILHTDIYFPQIWADDRRFVTHRFQADFEVGVGLTTGQGSNPQAMLQWSNDGGFTWSNEHWRSLGSIGVRRRRVMWRRLGAARQRTYRLRITDPVKRAFLGATADIEGGAV